MKETLDDYLRRKIYEHHNYTGPGMDYVREGRIYNGLDFEIDDYSIYN